MEWAAIYGRDRKVLLAMEALARRGGRVEALEKRPRVRADLTPVWSAFWTLAARRSYTAGMGAVIPNPLPLSEMIVWLDLHEVADPETRREYCYLLSEMDDIWIASSNRKTEKVEGSPDGNDRRGRPAGQD